MTRGARSKTALGVVAPKAEGGDALEERSRGANDTPPAFAVYCQKFDGKRYLFNRYSTRAEANNVAATLRGVGCPATVEAAP